MHLPELILNLLIPKFNSDYSSFSSYLTPKEIECQKFLVKSLSKEQEKFLKQIYSSSSYQNPIIKNLILKAKLQGISSIAKDLAELILYQIKKHEINFPDLICNTPFDPNRIKKRGYHLPYKICHYLSQKSSLLHIDILHKKESTQSQTELEKKDRLKNLDNKFSLKTTFNPSDLKKFNSVWIIDDVTTTGTTLLESAKTLKKFNFNLKIYGLTVAG